MVVAGEEVEVFLDGYDKTSGQLEVAQEGSLSDPIEGILVLAQDQDKPGGGFDPKQSFSGMISDFNIFSRYVKILIICQNCFH